MSFYDVIQGCMLYRGALSLVIKPVKFMDLMLLTGDYICFSTYNPALSS